MSRNSQILQNSNLVTVSELKKGKHRTARVAILRKIFSHKRIFVSAEAGALLVYHITMKTITNLLRDVR